MILEFDLSPEKADELIQAIKDGKLKHVGVVDAAIIQPGGEHSERPKPNLALAATTPEFRQLNLIRPLLDALDHAGYVTTSPLQAALIPLALEGRDILGLAASGTGRKAAYLLPFMDSWRGGDPLKPQALVLAPTSERALHVVTEANKLAPSRFFRSVALYHDDDARQVELLLKGCALVVGTPEKVIDHIQRGTLPISEFRYVVLDDIDMTIAAGNQPAIDAILSNIPTQRQTILICSNLPEEVLRLADKALNAPVEIGTNLEFHPPGRKSDSSDEAHFSNDEIQHAVAHALANPAKYSEILDENVIAALEAYSSPGMRLGLVRIKAADRRNLFKLAGAYKKAMVKQA